MELYEALKDGRPHSSFELVKSVYGATGPSIARLGARIWDLKHDGCMIESWKDEKNKAMWWYQMHVPKSTTLFKK